MSSEAFYQAPAFCAFVTLCASKDCWAHTEPQADLIPFLLGEDQHLYPSHLDYDRQQSPPQSPDLQATSIPARGERGASTDLAPAPVLHGFPRPCISSLAAVGWAGGRSGSRGPSRTVSMLPAMLLLFSQEQAMFMTQLSHSCSRVAGAECVKILSQSTVGIHQVPS